MGESQEERREEKGLEDQIARLEREKRELGFKALFVQQNPSPVFRVCEKGGIQWSNDAAQNLFGDKIGPMATIGDILPDIDPGVVDDIIDQGYIVSFTTEVSGRQIQFTMRGEPHYAAAHFYGSDVTDLKETQSRLEETLAELHSVMDTSAVGIARTREGKLVWVNRECEKIFGYGPGEMTGEPIKALMELADWERFLDPSLEWGKKVTAGGVHHMEPILHRKDGSRFLGRLQIKAINPDDLSQGYITVVEDFSERKKMEEALRDEKERAEEATRLKDKFVSLVTHDLRSPITTIVSFLKLLETIAGADEKSRTEIVGRAMKSAEGALELIENLLDINRLQTGKLRPAAKVFSSTLIASQVLADFSWLAEEKGVILKNDTDPGDYPIGDPELIREVIRNLVSNAIKFTPQGGEVTLVTPQPFALGVRDTGRGMSEREQQKVFRPDIKTSRPGTAGEVGTGMGLPLAREIMEAHGGSLTVTSTEGEGSLFVAELPVRKPVTVILSNDAQGKEEILKSLTELDLETKEGAIDEKGEELVATVAPQLVVIDACPDRPLLMSMVEKIKSSDGDAPPVIVMAPRDCESIRESAFSSGADDVASRPVNSSDFVPRVKKYIWGRMAL